jgi:hypothetical protein
MTNNKLGIVARQEISYELFENIIVLALECGSRYWYSSIDLEFTSSNLLEKYATDPDAIRVAKLVWYDHINLRVMDAEDEDLSLGEVNLTTIKTAFEITCSQYPETYLNLINHNFNHKDADVFFQIATMGKVNFANS